MIRLLMLVIFTLSFNVSYSSVKGLANVSVGFSMDDDDLSNGIVADYAVSNDSYFQSWDGEVNLAYSSAKNRPSAINGHQYLYENSALGGTFSHLLKSASPFINFNSGADYKQSGEVDAEGRSNSSWNTFTGPTLNKYIRSDILLELNFRQGRQKINDIKSTDTYWDARVHKKIDSTTDIEGNFQNNCWYYKSDSALDNCKKTVEVVYNTSAASTNVNVYIGQVIIDESEQSIYGIKIKYIFNKINSVSLNSSKQQTNFTDALELTEGAINQVSPEAIITNNSVLYERNFKRLSMKIEYDESKLRNNELHSKEGKSSFFASYLLGSNRCNSCSLQFEYLKKNKINEGWVTWEAGLKYPLKRHWNTNISIRSTKQNLGEDALSFNIQLNYNGKSALVR
jgi:hypothetical protein